MAKQLTERPSAGKKLEYGKSGLGKLVKLDAGRARLDFDDGNSVPFTVVQGNVFENEDATLPEYVPFGAMMDNTHLPVRASFEKGDKRILFINPSSGELRVKFVKFQAPQGSVPTWEEKPGIGKNSSYREANPFVEVIDGRWKGATIRGRLFDNFGRDADDGNTTIFIGKKGVSSMNLKDFCACVGFEYWTTPYSENLLPEIQKVALENGNEFSIQLINGYIANWIAGFDEEDVFADATPAPTSSAEALLDE